MTDTSEDPIEDAEDSVPARKWCWWLLPAMVFGLFANMSRASACFFDELSMGFGCHSNWKQQLADEKQDEAADTKIVSRFREQLTEL